LERYANQVADVKSRRQSAAEQTQRDIVEAAARLFTEHGYHATSISRIASEAGVAVQTVYNAVGAKREVLSRVLDYAAAGPQAPTRVPEFMRRQGEAQDDPRAIVGGLVSFWTEALPRTAPVFRIIREAAAVDPEAAGLERTRAAQRLHNYEHAGRLLEERQALRAGLTPGDAAAIIFAIGHPETFRALVLDGAWTVEQWAAWARDALSVALLAPPPAV
jgi:AcrR family transcriptional regulator